MFEKVDLEELNKMDEILEQQKKDKSLIIEDKKKIENTSRQINSSYTNIQLIDEINKQTTKINKKNERLSKFEDGTIVKVPEEKMGESERLLDNNLKNYKKAKKVVLSVLDTFGEGMELNRKELSEQMGLEEETELLGNLK